MRNQKTGRKLKVWKPTEEQENIIRTKYADYYLNKVTLTKSRLCEMFKVTAPQFDRWCGLDGVKPIKRNKKENKDFTGYKRIPVPCKRNCESGTTFLLVPPDRDVKKAKENYLKRYKECKK